jgi:hypothetical protein
VTTDTQTEFFPKTELDQAHQILSHLVNEQEKAETALDNAEKKLSEANGRVYKQRQVIAWLQDKMPAVDPVVESEGDDVEDAEVLQIEGEVLDPITGELTRSTLCPDCGGDGRKPDKTGGGHHGTCETCEGEGVVRVPVAPEAGSQALADGLEPVAEEMLADLESEGVIVAGDEGEDRTPAAARGGAVVIAVYPNEDPVATPVGPTTQYAELIGDYLSAGGEGTIEDWRVVAELELADPDLEYGRREPHEVIMADDYGHRLLVVSAEQGSVVGEESAA